MKSDKIILLFAILSFSLLFLGCTQQPPAPPASNQTQAMNNSTAQMPPNLPPLEITVSGVPDVSNSTPIYIEGRVSREAQVTLNQKALEVSNGSFTAYLALAEGQNRFVFEATDSYGNKNTLVKVVRYNSSIASGSNQTAAPYIPENGTLAEKSIPVTITVTNSTAYLGFNVSDGSDVLGLGTISEGKSSARKVILTNEEASAVYVHFNGTGNISDFFVYPEPFTMYALGETHEIWIKALIPFNTSLGTYDGAFLIQEIRENAPAQGGNSSQNQ